MKKILCALVVTALLLSVVGCGGAPASNNQASTPDNQPSAPPEKTALVFADVGWDSIQLNNALAGLVAEKVFGYTWIETPASTPIAHEALMQGDLDVHMEEWTDNLPPYKADLAAGKFVELGVNFADNFQGFYIPRYLADANPGLRSVQDLADYAHLFPDPENPGKARIYGGIPGWEITEIMEKKINVYGLSDKYNYIIPGSNPALDVVITSAWDKQEPLVTYYWEPTWLLGKYDFLLLEDTPYDAEKYQDGYGACPAVRVTVAVSNDFAASNPVYCEFLSKFKMPSALVSECLAYMQDSNSSHADAAKWLLSEKHPELVDDWLNPEQAEKLRAAL